MGFPGTGPIDGLGLRGFKSLGFRNLSTLRMALLANALQRQTQGRQRTPVKTAMTVGPVETSHEAAEQEVMIRNYTRSEHICHTNESSDGLRKPTPARKPGGSPTTENALRHSQDTETESDKLGLRRVTPHALGIQCWGF